MKYYLRVFYPNHIQDVILEDTSIIGDADCPILGSEEIYSFYLAEDGYMVSSTKGTIMLKEGQYLRFSEEVKGLLIQQEAECMAEVSADKVSRLTIGRSTDRDLVLPSRNNVGSDTKEVAREHLTLERTTSGWSVHPDKAQAKVYINGRAVSGSAVFNENMTLCIGKYTIVFWNGILAAFALPFPVIQNRMNEENAGLQQTDEGKPAKQTKVIEPPFFNRSPHIKTSMPDYETRVPTKERFGEKPEFNWVSTLLPPIGMLVIMLGIFLLTGNAMSLMYTVPMYAISMVVAITNYRSQKKKFFKRKALSEQLFSRQIEEEELNVKKIKEHQLAILKEQFPSLDTCVAMAKHRDSRLWRVRPSEELFMELRLGTGRVPTNFKVQSSVIASDEQLQRLLDEASYLTEAPVSCPLGKHCAVGLIGNRADCVSIAKNIIVQAAANHAFDELKIVLLYSDAEKAEWEWARWLPHVWNSERTRRYLASEGGSVTRLVRELEDIMAQRLNPAGQAGEIGAHFLIIAADTGLIRSAALMKHLTSGNPALNVSTVFMEENSGRLPGGCDAIIEVNQKGEGVWYPTNDKSDEHSFEPDWMNASRYEDFSRLLAPIRLAKSEQNTLPSVVSFLDGYGVKSVEELNIEQRWQSGNPSKSLAVPVGVKSNGDLFEFDVHERKHGPHGMASGQTRSGKSEMVQSWILSLALNFRPDQVAFVIVDFKGEGLLAPFRTLPHLAGTISNLDHNVERNVVALQQEMNRRMAIFKKYKVANIFQYARLYEQGKAADQVPFLIIAVDEFAEIKVTHPEFMAAIDRVYTLGGSLGLSIIILAQDAASAAGDKILANSRFRWCMKVATADASRGMLDTLDAYTMPSTPGRGFVKVGDYEVYEQIQSFWSGADYRPNGETDESEQIKHNVALVDIDGTRHELTDTEKYSGKPKGVSKEIDRVVEYICGYVAQNQIPRALQIWEPPMPPVIALDDVLSNGFSAGGWPDSGNVKLTVGKVDDPHQQRQYPLSFHLSQSGHISVQGRPESGKTTFLLTAVMSLAEQYSPDSVSMYLFDYDKWSLNLVRNLPHVLGSTAAAEQDEVQSIIDSIQNELSRRKTLFLKAGAISHDGYCASVEKIPAIFLIVDNITAAWDDSNHMQELLYDVAMKGAGYGIYLIATAPGSTFPFKLSNFFKTKLTLNQNEKSDYTSIVGMSEIMPEPYPGRGLVKLDYPVEFQTAMPAPGEGELERNKNLHEIVAAMKNAWKSSAQNSAEKVSSSYKMVDGDIILATDKLLLQPILWSESGKHVLVVSASDERQRIQFVELLLTQIGKQNSQAIIVDDSDKTLEERAESAAHYYSLSFVENHFDQCISDLLPTLQERLEEHEQNKNSTFDPIVILISEYGGFFDVAADESINTLKEIVQLGKDLGVFLFVIGNMDSWVRLGNAGEKLTHALLRQKHALLLGASFNSHQVFSSQMPYEKLEKTLQTDEGWYILDGKTRQIVQLQEGDVNQ